jgi:hypothetical protein
MHNIETQEGSSLEARHAAFMEESFAKLLEGNPEFASIVSMLKGKEISISDPEITQTLKASLETRN